jgi:uncharacterized oxidoreductase
MKISGNTILITGGGSGIGRGLAESFQALGNQVIIAGRRKELLESVTAKNPGMKSVVLDVDDRAGFKAFAGRISAQFPALNVLINNAGIMKGEDLTHSPPDTSIAEQTLRTNLLGPIALTAELLPQLTQQPFAAVMMVSSGLAFMPLAMTPTYCATKAAIHSYAQSLRFQLRDTRVEVLELVPPYVATELMGPHQAHDPQAMPLPEFIAEVMQILKTQPGAAEICVKRVHPLRFAEAQGADKYTEQFRAFNQFAAAAFKTGG